MSENKNMTSCKTCGKEIEKCVKKCPHCVKDQRNFFMQHKILTGVLVLVIIGMIGSLSNKENNNTNSSNSKNPSTTTSSAAESDTAGNSNSSKKAETYSKTMHMSKRGIYDQLTSEHGEKFTPSEAKYAIDHLGD